jgi:hypothetical protein
MEPLSAASSTSTSTLQSQCLMTRGVELRHLNASAHDVELIHVSWSTIPSAIKAVLRFTKVQRRHIEHRVK